MVGWLVVWPDEIGLAGRLARKGEEEKAPLGGALGGRFYTFISV